ncbi:hypothetical protein ABZR88_05815 [Mucilaginibacter yixingensis]|nr:hypothetical protein [Mucilaginibacter yixingensis]
MKAYLLSTLAVAALLSAQSCKKSADVIAPIKDTTKTVTPPPVDNPPPVNIPSASYNLALLSNTTAFETTPVVSVMANQTHDELSGLAAGHKNPGLLYTHEDSGNANEVYVTNAKGDDLGKIVLDGVYNRDWEDIECGPGPDAGKNYIYVAEIGDNDAAYRSVSVYRFEEPDLTGANAQTVVHVTPQTLQFVYPTGAVNAETLMLDPQTKDLYIATKQPSKSTLYVARYPQSTTTTTTLTPLANFPFDLLTAGDISPDGSEILLRNTGQIWYWKRQTGEDVVTTLLRSPLDAPYGQNEHQGESVCFASDAGGYFTVSETKKYPGDKSQLSFYKRK